MQKKISQQLLDRYVNGQCTPEEEHFIRQWYYSFHNEDDRIRSLTDKEKNQTKDRVYKQIAKKLSSDKEFDLADQKISIKIKYLKYTALLAAAIYLCYIALPFLQKNNLQPLQASQLITLNNTGKNIREQIMNDGSHIWLSPGAQLVYARDFGKVNRYLQMSGEAFFEVTKNPLKPFIINSKHLVTKVWGTSFQVKDPKNVSSALVSVVTGKVSVSLTPSATGNIKKTASVMLYPRQQARYSERDNTIYTEQPDPDSMFIWKKTNLFFDNSSLKTIIPVLNKEFGLTIKINDKSLDDYFVTADFKGLNFPQVMEVLRNTLNINYEMSGKEILLLKN